MKHQIFAGQGGRGFSSGFTILEVLVAVVILAVGLLGMIGLQTSAVKQNQNAMARSIAAGYAESMLNKMRADTEEAKLGHYDIKSEGGNVPLASAGTAPYRETQRWIKNLETALPGAKVQVCRINLADGKYSQCTDKKGEAFRVCIRWDQGDSKLFDPKSQQVMLLGRL
ncbi:MAG: type IV pilus modification protein PilV [Zoogloeaceae bacterium]|nr:type IV pilus modification protein PilV [Zoogloeaceae bacterium]